MTATCRRRRSPGRQPVGDGIPAGRCPRCLGQSLSTLRGKGKVSAYKSSSSVSKPRVRQNRHKQGLNQTIEKLSADFRQHIISMNSPCNLSYNLWIIRGQLMAIRVKYKRIIPMNSCVPLVASDQRSSGPCNLPYNSYVITS